MVLGLVGAYFVGRVMQSFLFGVGKVDFSAFGAVSLILLLAAQPVSAQPGDWDDDSHHHHGNGARILVLRDLLRLLRKGKPGAAGAPQRARDTETEFQPVAAAS